MVSRYGKHFIFCVYLQLFCQCYGECLTCCARAQRSEQRAGFVDDGIET